MQVLYLLSLLHLLLQEIIFLILKVFQLLLHFFQAFLKFFLYYIYIDYLFLLCMLSLIHISKASASCDDKYALVKLSTIPNINPPKTAPGKDVYKRQILFFQLCIVHMVNLVFHRMILLPYHSLILLHIY